MRAPGTFLITFDVELIWGVFFDAGWRRRAEQRWGSVRDVFADILSVLDRHGIPATFAFVGHLFLDRCERGPDGRTHGEMPRFEHAFFPGDWYDLDPGTNLETDSLWYGADLVAAVRDAAPDHEIGCHGFSHAFLESDRDLARAEIAASAAAAREAGFEPRSFVYPQNRVGFTDELAPAGFTHYRETYEKPSRAVSLLLRAIGDDPPVARAVRTGDVIRVPGGLPIVPAMGVRRIVTMRSRLREIRRGLARAAAEEAVFHLWTHPHNFVEGREFMIRYLDRAMEIVARARDEGAVDVVTMSGVTA
ncbi:MAG: polysaccharide deacetylase family protein [Planctomycetota bacterium]